MTKYILWCIAPTCLLSHSGHLCSYTYPKIITMWNLRRQSSPTHLSMLSPKNSISTATVLAYRITIDDFRTDISTGHSDKLL